jgi:hypothetical protein
VLCQLECTGAFRAEVLRWVPGYGPVAEPVPGHSGISRAAVVAEANSVAKAQGAADAVGAREAC